LSQSVDDANRCLASGLQQHGGALVRIGGGHGATGDEGAALDEPAIERAVAEHASHVEAFAIAAKLFRAEPGS